MNINESRTLADARASCPHLSDHEWNVIRGLSQVIGERQALVLLTNNAPAEHQRIAFNFIAKEAVLPLRLHLKRPLHLGKVCLGSSESNLINDPSGSKGIAGTTSCDSLSLSGIIRVSLNMSCKAIALRFMFHDG
jgi:hypothetical protein